MRTPLALASSTGIALLFFLRAALGLGRRRAATVPVAEGA
jgi:hypothetical protein